MKVLKIAKYLKSQNQWVLWYWVVYSLWDKSREDEVFNPAACSSFSTSTIWENYFPTHTAGFVGAGHISLHNFKYFTKKSSFCSKDLDIFFQCVLCCFVHIVFWNTQKNCNDDNVTHSSGMSWMSGILISTHIQLLYAISFLTVLPHK